MPGIVFISIFPIDPAPISTTSTSVISISLLSPSALHPFSVSPLPIVLSAAHFFSVALSLIFLELPSLRLPLLLSTLAIWPPAIASPWPRPQEADDSSILHDASRMDEPGTACMPCVHHKDRKTREFLTVAGRLGGSAV